MTTPSWVVASGHYPVYSTGEHADSEELIENLVPLFEVYIRHYSLCLLINAMIDYISFYSIW